MTTVKSKKVTLRNSPRTKAKKKSAGSVRKRVRVRERNLDFYQQLRLEIDEWLNKKVGREHEWAEYIMLVPDFLHLLIRLTLDPKLPVVEKGKLALVIAYFISPMDLIPELVLGPVAFVDDLALTCLYLDSLINKKGAGLVEKHWAGKKDLLKTIQKVLSNADKMVGSRVWGKLRKLLMGK